MLLLFLLFLLAYLVVVFCGSGSRGPKHYRCQESGSGASILPGMDRGGGDVVLEPEAGAVTS